MIEIKLRDFRGCATADIECAPIALVAGQNAAGKTSVAQAVGAALTGNALPIAGLRSSHSNVFVRAGAEQATVLVQSSEGTVGIQWPKAQAVSTGKPPQASEYATGLASIVTLAPKDRLRVLAEYLHADPTREDVGAALEEAGLGGEKALDTIWDLIEQQGWDGAERTRRERGQEMKGQWRATTGANYGSRIAASWRPDLEVFRESDLLAAVTKARADRDNAMTAVAVSDSERRRLEEEAGLLDLRRGALERATARVDECAGIYARAQEHRATLPPASRQDGFPCPHCGAFILAVRVGVVETRYEKAPAVDITDSQLKARRIAIADADGLMSKALGDLNAARRDAGAAEAAIARSIEAQERLANWPAGIETGTDRAAAEAALERAEKMLAEYRQKIEADRVHRLIEGNEIVIGLLAGDGLRAKKLDQVLDVFNGVTLDQISTAAGWKPVHIDRTAAIEYGGRPYALLSSSEQYRVRAALAVAMAQLDGSELVILDGADILDAPSRSGLFDLLESVGIPALVTMTLARREQVPDLAAAELGRSYWLSSGVVEPLEAKIAA